MEQYMPFIWIGFAVLMAVCEALTTQLVSIWFVLGGIAAAISTVFTPSIPIQSAVFLIVSLLCLIITRPLVKRFKKNRRIVNTNADRLVGQSGVVTMDIPDCDTVGQVKVSGEVWSALSNDAPVLKGSKIKVLSIEGVKLIVEKL